jgi:hypothetical protein
MSKSLFQQYEAKRKMFLPEMNMFANIVEITAKEKP